MARLKALILSCLNSWLISLVTFSSRWLCPGTASRHLIQLMMFQLQEEDWLKLDFLIEHCQILTRLLQFDFSLRSLNLAWSFQLLAELLENISVRGSDCRLQRKRSVSSCLPWKLNHFLHISMLYLHFGRGSPRLFCRVFTLTFSSLSSLILASPFAKFQDICSTPCILQFIPDVQQHHRLSNLRKLFRPMCVIAHSWNWTNTQFVNFQENRSRTCSWPSIHEL